MRGREALAREREKTQEDHAGSKVLKGQTQDPPRKGKEQKAWRGGKKANNYCTQKKKPVPRRNGMQKEPSATFNRDFDPQR